MNIFKIEDAVAISKVALKKDSEKTTIESITDTYNVEKGKLLKNKENGFLSKEKYVELKDLLKQKYILKKENYTNKK